MAERSKAPDSRFTPSFAQLSAKDRAFWSTNVGAGSNPASDKSFITYVTSNIKLLKCDTSTCVATAIVVSNI